MATFMKLFGGFPGGLFLRVQHCHCCGSGLIPGPRELPHATGAGKEKGTGRTWGLQSRTRKQNMEVLHTRDEELQTESRWVPEEKTQYIWPCFD